MPEQAVPTIVMGDIAFNAVGSQENRYYSRVAFTFDREAAQVSTNMDFGQETFELTGNYENEGSGHVLYVTRDQSGRSLEVFRVSGSQTGRLSWRRSL